VESTTAVVESVGFAVVSVVTEVESVFCVEADPEPQATNATVAKIAKINVVFLIKVNIRKLNYKTKSNEKTPTSCWGLRSLGGFNPT
jgi:hypothetical protein